MAIRDVHGFINQIELKHSNDFIVVKIALVKKKSINFRHLDLSILLCTLWFEK